MPNTLSPRPEAASGPKSRRFEGFRIIRGPWKPGAAVSGGSGCHWMPTSGGGVNRSKLGLSAFWFPSGFVATCPSGDTEPLHAGSQVPLERAFSGRWLCSATQCPRTDDQTTTLDRFRAAYYRDRNTADQRPESDRSQNSFRLRPLLIVEGVVGHWGDEGAVT